MLYRATEFAVTKIIQFMPILFGFGFLGPLFAQIMQTMGWQPPFGIAPLWLGLALGGVLGVFAYLRGSWIWARP